MRTYIILIISFLCAELASFFIFFKLVTMWLDASYVASLHLPSDADSLGIPIFGSLILGLLVSSAVFTIHMILLGIILYRKSLNIKLNLGIALLKHKSPGNNILKIIVILFTATWMVFLALPIPGIYEYVNPLYVVTDIISTLCGVIATVAFCMIVGGFKQDIA